MIEAYAIAAGALIVIGGFLGILGIRALGARSQKANRVAATTHFDAITIGPRAVRSAEVVTYPGSPRVGVTRHVELDAA